MPTNGQGHLLNADGTLNVQLRSSSGNEAPISNQFSQVDDIPTGGYSLGVGTYSLAFNNAKWDRWRNNTEGTLLAPAARTVTTTSTNQINHNARGVLLTLNVTANPGGTEVINFYVQMVDSIIGTGSYGQWVTMTVKPNVNEMYRMLMYPGATSVPDLAVNGNQKAVSSALPRSWKAVVGHSGSGSWSYSLAYQYIL